MSLSIYYSDKIEELAEHLKGKLVEERRAADPFAFSQVVVPNTNIAKWLRIRMFADTPELCMGIEFPFIENALFGLLAECLPAEGRPKLLPMNAYSTGILSILLKDGDKDFEPFRQYIADGKAGPLVIDSREKARMAWQLSVKLADLMDKYEVHRPKIVSNWLEENHDAEGKPLVTGSVEAAEAALAKKLFGEGGLYPPDNSGGNGLSLRQLFDLVQNTVGKPPTSDKTIYFFGLSTLSSLQARILHWLAKTHDVVFYHNNVCMEYWGDIEKKEERIKRLGKNHSPEADIEIENPLLSQWGIAGRGTMRLLVDLEEEGGDQVGFTWTSVSDPGRTEPQTLLGKIQHSILCRTSDVKKRLPQDASLQIAAAPGVRREVEMVYNAILGSVWKPKAAIGERPWGDCKFSDIAVLVPDMATYRPVIEAVFDGRGQIPYGLIDTSASEDSVYLRGFLDLMALARDGLSRETLFAVLDNPCVQRALSFGPGDVKSWRRYAKGAGAFDGFEVEEKKKEYRNFSWSEALRRLRLGVVAENGDNLVVWDGGDDGSALKFSAIVETLCRELAPLASDTRECATKPEDGDSAKDDETTWYGKLRRIANVFLAVERDDKLEGPVKGQLFGTLSSLSGIEGRQGLDLVVAAVEQFVGGVKCQKGSYLTNGVTIAGLQPMRPVPFKQVFVLGMGEGMFPGRDSATTLEIRGAQRTLGDMQPTKMKKYLFLETLMAVKERLVLSYPCLDPVKDAELFPSGMVCELEKFLERYVLPKTKSEDGKEAATPFQEVKLPLLERAEPDDFLHHRDGHPEDDVRENPVGPITWTDNWYAGLIPTYSNVERGISRKLAGGGRGDVPTDEAPIPGASQERITIKTKELAEFLKSPLHAALRYRHGIAVEGYKDDSIDPDAPLEIPSGPDQWEFQRKLLEAVSGGAPDIESVYAPFAAVGKLPEPGGFLGRYSVDKTSASLKGKEEDLAKLKAFVDGFLPAGWEEHRPDPVRTVAKADATRSLPERLYTGQTQNWVLAEDKTACSVLLFNKCSDEKDKKATFPPKAVLGPFVTWAAMVAGADDEREHSLRVGIADLDQLQSDVWKWTITRAKAKEWLDEVSATYLHYLGAPNAGGAYLDFGCPDLAKAFVAVAAKKKKEGEAKDKEKKKKGKDEEPDSTNAAADGGRWVPKTDADWKTVVNSFPSDDDYGGDKKGFDNSLVIDETVQPFSRQPGDGDDKTAEQDIKAVKNSYEKIMELPMSGNRE